MLPHQKNENARNFTAPYVFQEFPKYVTLADGTQILVNNEEEEAVAVGPVDDEDSTHPLIGDAEVERKALYDEAKALGLDPHSRTGVPKLRNMIAAAKG